MAVLTIPKKAAKHYLRNFLESIQLYIMNIIKLLTTSLSVMLHFRNGVLINKNLIKYLCLQGFTGRDGKLDYDRLLNSLHNQSFRRRWLKSATLYMSDWANYIADPEVYNRYVCLIH